MRNNHLTLGIVISVFALLFTSCKEDNDSDVIAPVKTESKSLDLVHRIRVVVREGHLHGKSFHANAQPVGSPFRRKKFFDLERGTDGQWEHVKGSDSIDYVQAGKPLIMKGKNSLSKPEEGFRYGFEFIYLDKAGKRMNSHFFQKSDVYQTLFSVDGYTENKTGTSVKLDKTSDLFSYLYRDTDPEDKMIKEEGTTLAKNFLGLKGYASIKKSKISYTLKVNLVQFKSAKDKKEEPYFDGVDGSTVEDKLTINIPINVLAAHPWTDEDFEDYISLFAEYFNISKKDFEDIDVLGDVDPESSKYWM